MGVIKETEQMSADVHKSGHKLLVIGQPITGNFVPKKTYVSAINLINPINMIDLLHTHKVMSTMRVISDFPIDYNRNKFVDEALEMGADYIMFMDMDMTFPANMLNLLMENISDEHPIVSGMYYMKYDPFRPVVGRYVDWDNELLEHRDELKAMGFVKEESHDLGEEKQCLNWRPVTYFDHDKPFLADVIGMGCVLVKAEVFKKIKQPYFRYSHDPRKSKPYLNSISEDMYWCAQLKKAGIPILIDPRVQCGHISELVVNNPMFEAHREASFQQAEVESPKEFERIKGLMLDVREEQKKWN